jgi:hypothetical protein
MYVLIVLFVLFLLVMCVGLDLQDKIWDFGSMARSKQAEWAKPSQASSKPSKASLAMSLREDVDQSAFGKRLGNTITETMFL